MGTVRRVCQAAAAYALSFVFAHTDGDYRLLFLIGTAAMVMALAIDFIATITATRKEPRT